MDFENPVTYRKRNGSQATSSSFRLLLIDDSAARLVSAYLLPAPGRLILWSGDAYDEAGDYTQAEAEARVTAVLGSNPGEALSAPLPPHLTPQLPEPTQNPY